MSGSLPPGVNLCEVPALPAPPGHVSNFVNPVTLAPVTWAVGFISTIFAVSLVVLRLFMNMRKLDAADYFMAVGGIFSVPYAGLVMSLHRYNRHQWDVPACWVDERYLRIICASDSIVGVINFFPKCSILLMYRRLFPTKWMKIGTWIGFVFAFCLYLPTIPVLVFYEVPRSGHTWDVFLDNLVTSEGQGMLYMSIVQGSCSVLLDLYIFILPPPTLFKLKLPLRKRLQLLVLFATALMGVIASVISLVYRCEPLHSQDSTWSQARLAICVVFETNVAIAVGSMPIIAKFVRSSHVVDSFRSLRSKLLGGSGKGRSYPISLGVPEPFNLKNTPWKPPRRNQYCEFTDSMLLVRTQVTAADEENPPVKEAINTNREGIIHTIDITQQSQLRDQSLSQEQRL